MEMNKSRVVEILEFYKEIDGEIDICRRNLIDYENQYYNTVGAMVNDGQPKGQGCISRQVESAAMNIPDYVREEMKAYEEKTRALLLLKNQILQEVSRLCLKEKKIIYDFYIYNMKWERVAERNHYSERQCKNIRDAAIKKLLQWFQNNQHIMGFKWENI